MPGSVSIHAPARGATSHKKRYNSWCGFQSTRPHGARLTASYRRRSPFKFQSTRPHGARLQLLASLHLSPLFQSTRPHGARHYIFLVCVILGGVSIHAPARGATRVLNYPPYNTQGFNPRARTGRDMRIVNMALSYYEFQSTRPHGARHSTRA